jgi:dipeptide/tripeptide permease
MVDSPGFVRFLHLVHLDSAERWSFAFGLTGVGMLFSLVNFLLRRRLIKDLTLEGREEPRPAGLAFVAFQVALVVALAYFVIASQNLVVQLVAGIGGALFLMFGVAGIINRGWVRTRTVSGAPAGSAAHAAHHRLGPNDWKRIGVVGLMITFSLIFWMLFQQAGSTFNIFARDYSRRVFGNPEANAVSLEQARLRVNELPPADRAVKAFDKTFDALRVQDGPLVAGTLRLRAMDKEIRTLQDLKPADETARQTARRAAYVARLRGEQALLQGQVKAGQAQDPAVAAQLETLTGQLKGAEDALSAVARREKELGRRKNALLESRGGVEFPAIYVLVTNPTLVVLFGALFAALWRRRAGKWPSSPVKFALGLLFAGVALLVMSGAAALAQPRLGEVQQVSLAWLFGTYVFATLGELCLSPVGLAYVSKLAPEQLGGQMMGLWFFGSGLGSYAAGRIAGAMVGHQLWHIFILCAGLALLASFVLWVFVSRFIAKVMGGYS